MRTLLLPFFMVLAAGILVGCEPAAETPTQATAMRDDAKASLETMEAQDPTLKLLVDNSYGYAIFPEVGQGAVGIGGAGGDGVIYKAGQRIGTARLSQASVGVALGAQTYAELILFQDEKSFNRMLNDSVEFGADASATVVKASAAGAGHFSNGTEIYISGKGGLMAGVSINGQKFHYTPSGN